VTRVVDGGTQPHARTAVIDAAPDGRRQFLASLVAHRHVFVMLARKDFQTRYKRASLGIVWAVAVPVLQGVVLAIVFSKVVRVQGTEHYGAMVFAGVVAFSYFASTLTAAVTSIVDGSGLTDKVWFPRILLVLVPAAANLVGLAVSVAVLIVALPFLGVGLSPRLALLVPAGALLLAFTAALSLVAAALHVYFRDVKFLVQAALLVWIYVTPVLYPREAVGDLGPWLDLNPMTGIVLLFQQAAVGGVDDLARPVAVSLVWTVALLVIGLEAQRRHDRLFVDLL